MKELEDKNINLNINLEVQHNEISVLKEEIDKLKETGDDNLLEIVRLNDQLIEERKKVSDLDNETESQS